MSATTSAIWDKYKRLFFLLLLVLLRNITRKLILRDIITQYWYAWDFCGDLIRLFSGIDYFPPLLLTLYLKGKTQVEPDCVTQLLGTLCWGILVSANLNPDPEPITASKVITKLLILMSLCILSCIKEGMFLLIHTHRFYQSKNCCFLNYQISPLVPKQSVCPSNSHRLGRQANIWFNQTQDSLGSLSLIQWVATDSIWKYLAVINI